MNTAPAVSHALPRRRFIALVGGGAVLAAAPLAGCSTAYPPAAVAAWQTQAEPTDVRRWMLAHGLLAPNPHNRQPWIADLRREGEITLICDGERLLPETDPYGRQILIGCGAFIELAVMAAAERGYRVQVQAFPEGEPSLTELPGGRVVARLKIERDAAVAKDPLFAQIRRRHTHKGAYDNARSVPADAWQALQTAATDRGLKAGSITDAAAMAQVRKITRDSFETEIVTPRTYLESARLMRIGPDEVAKYRDGISLMDGMVQVLTKAGMFDRFEVPVLGSANHKRTMDRWNAHETGSGYYWITSSTNTRSHQLDSGRAYVRAHLQATSLGIDMHPLSQAVQEFVEVKPQFDALRTLLGLNGTSTVVQMLVRVGYGAAGGKAPTPRRDVAQLIRA
jgi:nitroreductase